MSYWNRRFPEITNEDNLTVFSYSGKVKSLEWRWQRRRTDLRHFEIFRHGPIIIYTRLPAGRTYYPICTFPASSEWSGFLMPFLPFVYGYPSSSPRAHSTPNKSVPTLRYTRRHARRLLLSAVPWISEDRLLNSLWATEKLKAKKRVWPHRQGWRFLRSQILLWLHKCPSDETITQMLRMQKAYIRTLKIP